MNMKFKATLLGLSIAAVLPTMNMAQTPVYLDTSKPIEERVYSKVITLADINISARSAIKVGKCDI